MKTSSSNKGLVGLHRPFSKFVDFLHLGFAWRQLALRLSPIPLTALRSGSTSVKVSFFGVKPTEGALDENLHRFTRHF